jgi:RNA-directed DNA polymerase
VSDKARFSDTRQGAGHENGTGTERYGSTGGEQRAHLVRYADHLVLLSRTQGLAEHSLRELCGLLDPLGLRLNEEKSRIVHARDAFDFLGFHVRWVASDRTGRMFPLWRPRRAAVQRVRERLKARAKSACRSARMRG